MLINHPPNTLPTQEKKIKSKILHINQQFNKKKKVTLQVAMDSCDHHKSKAKCRSNQLQTSWVIILWSAMKSSAN